MYNSLTGLSTEVDLYKNKIAIAARCVYVHVSACYM